MNASDPVDSKRVCAFLGDKTEGRAYIGLY